MSLLNPLDYPACFSPLQKTDYVSAWVEHTPFGMFLVDILRPKVIVELGTNRGCSYLSFCQTVKQLGTETRCYAIDTWEGDLHAGFYGEQVLNDLRAYHNPLYGDFSRLVQGTFDDTLQYFPDASIDLLHIDGFHTYEAVKHDFETWLPKLSSHAIVLFHDTNVHERDFGVWKLWAELQQKYPSFEFFHGYGLGVLCLERNPASKLDALFQVTEAEAEQLRTFFSLLGGRFSAAARYQNIAAEREQHQRTIAARDSYKTRLAERGQQVLALKTEQKENNRRIRTLENEYSLLQQQQAEKDLAFQTLTAQNEATLQTVTQQKAVLENELHQISISKAWKLVLALRQIRFFVMPVNSGRERFARSLYRTIKGQK